MAHLLRNSSPTPIPTLTADKDFSGDSVGSHQEPCCSTHLPTNSDEEEGNGQITNLPKFNRYLILPPAILIQFCCGVLYAWSVLNTPIDTWIYPDNPTSNMAPLTFSIAIGTFGLSAALLGPSIGRAGPRTSTLFGTALYVSGYFLSALALHLRHIWLLYLGYGVIGSIGSAICYIAVVSLLQKWFPDRRGMASGLAVGGCAAGSMTAGQILLPLSQRVGLPLTFVVLGCGVLAPLLISGCLLKTPPQNFGNSSEKSPDSTELSAMSALISPNFRLLYLVFFANSLFGLVAMSRLSNMTRDIFGKTMEQGALVVSINGLFDLGGRLGFSLVSDWIGRKNTFVLILSLQLGVLGGLTAVSRSGSCGAFIACVWTLTGCYGAGFGLLAAFLSDSFGPSNVGITQGVIFTAWSLAGVGGGLIFTTVFHLVGGHDEFRGQMDPYPYNVNFWWILVVVGVGWVGLLFVSPTPKDNVFTGRVKRVWRKVSAPFDFSRRDSYEMGRK